MPAPRSGLFEDMAGFGFLQPLYSLRDNAPVVRNAMDIDCPNSACGAKSQQMCRLRKSRAIRSKPSVPLLCVERIELARNPRDEDEVVPVEPPLAEEPPKRKLGRPPGGGKMTPAVRAEVVERYLAGATTMGLAREYDVTDSTIRNVLDRVGARKRSTIE